MSDPVALNARAYIGEDADMQKTPREQVTVDMSAEECDRCLSVYDPTSGTSPSAAECRRIARVVLDALLAAKGRG